MPIALQKYQFSVTHTRHFGRAEYQYEIWIAEAVHASDKRTVAIIVAFITEIAHCRSGKRVVLFELQAAARYEAHPPSIVNGGHVGTVGFVGVGKVPYMTFILSYRPWIRCFANFPRFIPTPA